MPPETKASSGRLYIVATPIGNLEDVTSRGISVLRTVGLVVAEDTRVTKKLLDRLNIATPVKSLHHHSSDRDLQSVIEALRQGTSVAAVTDAGTPGVSDPGGALVAAAYDAGVPVVSVPGPSALTAALAISGLPADRFRFFGFLPHKKGRETMFRDIEAWPETSVFFESPHRLLKTLESLRAHLEERRTVVVCRELTKVFEEVVRGNPAEVFSVFADNPGKVRGEFVVVVSGRVD